MPASIEFAVAALALAAGLSDLRSRRIPNWITLPGALLGIALHLWHGGFTGVLASLAGAAIGLGIFMVFYMAGGMGAGDVKLFGAVGALVGPQALILVFVCTGLLGGLAALCLAAACGRLRESLDRAGDVLRGWALSRGRTAGDEDPAQAPNSLRLPYGAVIAGGALAALIILH